MRITLSALLLFTSLSICGQEPATSDLSFLLGEWDITRIYRPESQKPDTVRGTLKCETALEKQFISCLYDIPRTNKPRILDQVYYNYNAIYEHYESIWLSATWPIKPVMELNIISQEPMQIETTGEFSIGSEVTEYVKSEMSVSADAGFFERKTNIRTSKDPADQWTYHMIERGKKKK